MAIDFSAKFFKKFAGNIKQFIEVVSHQQNLEETSMKKNFLTAAAIMVVGFFVATEIAQAADVTFSGQIRSRLEIQDHKGNFGSATGAGFNPSVENDDFTSTRVRLNANVNVNESTSAFIQMQSVRTWGTDPTTTVGGNAGSGNASFTGSDGDASVGLHQAYFTLKNFAGAGVDLKLGRQEVVLDGHRLFGHTGWTAGAQTHDAVRMTHKHGDNATLDFVYISALEDGSTTSATTNISDSSQTHDLTVYVARANFQGLLGGNLSLYGVYNQDGCGGIVSGATPTCREVANDIYTVGFRQAGQLFGIDYRGEYYYQGGEANGDAAANDAALSYTSTGAGASGLNNNIDREAYMFGLRIGKKFNNVMMKPSLTIWYDELSGTDDEDVKSGTFGTFNTLFDTGHKFYGHMDLLGSTASTEALGLTDLAIKGSIQPMAGWTVKADYHWFGTEVDPSENSLARGVDVASSTDEDLGTELDIAIIHKYNANTVISAGWSQFTAERLFTEQNLVVGTSANWAYLQFDVKF
jgi:hypothetical protein